MLQMKGFSKGEVIIIFSTDFNVAAVCFQTAMSHEVGSGGPTIQHLCCWSSMCLTGQRSEGSLGSVGGTWAKRELCGGGKEQGSVKKTTETSQEIWRHRVDGS